MKTVAIIDDEPPAINLLTAYIQRTKSLSLQAAFTDPMEALDHYNRSASPQLTFLDIDMPGMNGIDLARLISHKTRIILTTSFRQYGPEAFELALSDYLLKPFSYERFLEAVKKATDSRSLQPGSGSAGYFYIRTTTRGQYLRINIPEIISSESKDGLIEITRLSDIVTAQHTLSELQDWLPENQFVRVHHSFVVNLTEVHAVDHGHIHLRNGTIIPIGRRYKEQFMNRLQQSLLSGRP